jgi:hypothetical protein
VDHLLAALVSAAGIRRMKNRSCILIALVIVGLIGAVVTWHWASRPKPLYGHIVLGPDSRIRVRFIVCGLDLYLDGNEDDVPQWSEFVGQVEIESPIERTDPVRSTRYVISGALMYMPHAVSAARPQELNLDVKILGPATYRQRGGPILSESPHKAGVARFHGPLAMRVRMNDLRLIAGPTPTRMHVEVSTYQPEVGGWAAVCSNRPGNRARYAFPPQVAPIVEIDFPAKTAGAPSIRRQFLLNENC